MLPMLLTFRPRPSAPLLALAGLFLSPAVADAAAVFPRGPGFYFNLVNLALVLLVYFIWLSVCNWVNKDAQVLHLPVDMWNGILFGAGAVGLFLVWIMPAFTLSFLLLVILFAAAAASYVYVRNQEVDAEDRVLTAQHLGSLWRR